MDSTQKQKLIRSANVLILLVAFFSLVGLFAERKENTQLKEQIEQLKLKEKRTTVMQSISQQMERIAYEQKDISDEERERALEQTKLANEMRARSEVERQNAITAQQNAIEAERTARDALEQAEQQRQIAEHQRLQAEFSKSLADTLSYVALARSLGSIAQTQMNAGNQEMATMLSYAAWMFNRRYHGDPYFPAIYKALSAVSRNTSTWPVHNGALMNLSLLRDDDNKVVTVSNYGGIILHEFRNGQKISSRHIFNDKTYDFRDITVGYDNNIYAISRTGHLFVFTKQGHKIIAIPGMSNAIKLEVFDDHHLYIVGENRLVFFDMRTQKIVNDKALFFQVVCVGGISPHPVIFDKEGKIHRINGINKITTADVPVKGKVTAYGVSENGRYQVYGMSDGTIYLQDRNKQPRPLIGHRSRISKVYVLGNRIYSAGYDGEVNLWVIDEDNEKIEPITLYQAPSWIMHFSLDRSRNNLWVGDRNGNLTQVLISMPPIVKRVEQRITRDFTNDEWDFFMGPNVPYESLLEYKRKEARR